MYYNTHLVPQPSSPRFVDPPDYTILCSSVPDSTPIMNEDQAIDGVEVGKPTCVVIHEEYDRASENEPTVKDDLLLSAPPPLFPNLIGDFVILDCVCVNPSMDESTSDHSQNTHDVSPSFDNIDKKLFIKNPLDISSSFSENVEGEHSCF